MSSIMAMWNSEPYLWWTPRLLLEWPTWWGTFLCYRSFQQSGPLREFQANTDHISSLLCIHENNYSQQLHMDSAVAEFLGVYECSYFRDTDFPKYHFGQGRFNPMLHFFGEWSKDDHVCTKMSSLSWTMYTTMSLHSSESGAPTLSNMWVLLAIKLVLVI